MRFSQICISYIDRTFICWKESLHICTHDFLCYLKRLFSSHCLCNACNYV